MVSMHAPENRTRERIERKTGTSPRAHAGRRRSARAPVPTAESFAAIAPAGSAAVLGAGLSRLEALASGPALGWGLPGFAPGAEGLSASLAAACSGLALAATLRGRLARWLGRRDAPGPALPPAVASWDALRTVRRLAEEEEGLDRDALAMLAEDDGLSPEDVGRAIEQWRRVGRLRIETDADGFDRVAWVGATPATPDEAEAG